MDHKSHNPAQFNFLASLQISDARPGWLARAAIGGRIALYEFAPAAQIARALLLDVKRPHQN